MKSYEPASLITLIRDRKNLVLAESCLKTGFQLKNGVFQIHESFFDSFDFIKIQSLM